MFDYVISLREGIMDAWGGIIGAMKAGGKSMSEPQKKRNVPNSILAPLLQSYVESIFGLLNIVFLDPNKSDALMRSSMGVIGYVFSSGS